MFDSLEMCVMKSYNVEVEQKGQINYISQIKRAVYMLSVIHVPFIFYALIVAPNGIFLFLVLMKDRCKLFCRVAGTMSYYQLHDRVVDGTPCGPDTYDICVQGLCRVPYTFSCILPGGNGLSVFGTILIICMSYIPSASRLRSCFELQGPE